MAAKETKKEVKATAPKVKKPNLEQKECPKCGRMLTMKRGKKPKCPYCRGAWFTKRGPRTVGEVLKEKKGEQGNK